MGVKAVESHMHSASKSSYKQTPGILFYSLRRASTPSPDNNNRDRSTASPDYVRVYADIESRGIMGNTQDTQHHQWPIPTPPDMGIMGNRQCAVRIKNKIMNDTLENPKYYCESGRCQDALTPTIGPHQQGSGLFTNTPGTARGSVGVFTYDLDHIFPKRVEKKMAVMFYIPDRFNPSSNLYAVGIFDRNQVCDKSLYDKMRYEDGPEFVRGRAGFDLTYKRDGLIISASMTDTEQSMLDVNISGIDGYRMF